MSSFSNRVALRASGLLSGLLVAGSLFASSASAEQVVVTDVKYTHSKDTTSDSHYRVSPLPSAPKNWKSPVDYTRGSVHVKLVVKTKPGAQPTKFQICFEGTPAYACTYQSDEYTKTGTYEWTTPWSALWYGGEVDWTKGVDKVALILKDTNNGKPQGDPKYVPTDLEVEVVLVSAGATFAPPGKDADAGAGKPAPALDGGTLGDAGDGEPPALVEDAAAPGKPSAGKDAAASRTASKDAGRGTTSDTGDDDDAADDGDDGADSSAGDKSGAKKDDAGCNLGPSSLTGGLPFGLAALALSTLTRRRRSYSSPE